MNMSIDLLFYMPESDMGYENILVVLGIKMRKLFVMAVLLLVGCAKGPSSELQKSNDCYDQIVTSHLSKIHGLIPTEDEIDIRVAENKLRQHMQNWMLKHQQANDITDPIGGLSSAFYGLDTAKTEYDDSWKEMAITFTRPSIPVEVSQYVRLSINDAFTTCYGSFE